MKTLDINLAKNVEIFNFPDGQPHVNVKNIEEGDDVEVICSMTSSNKILELLQISNALDNIFARKKVLTIPYLMGARYDRTMLPGDSFDLKVIANLINSCGFEKVILFDPHSSVSTALINNCIEVTNKALVTVYGMSDQAVLICPDAGAAKKIPDYMKWNKSFVDVVYCTKKRDLSTGSLSITVLEPEKCRGKDCVIIDDICDGGGTFVGIAKQILPKSLTLIISHGIFSKGFSLLEEHFDDIFTSDSLCANYDDSQKILSVNLRSDLRLIAEGKA
jgi:ribose-phosphate pyrophosphokinase